MKTSATTPNFTFDEKIYLHQIIDEHQIVFKKERGTVVDGLKKKAWETITNKYNKKVVLQVINLMIAIMLIDK